MDMSISCLFSLPLFYKIKPSAKPYAKVSKLNQEYFSLSNNIEMHNVCPDTDMQ